MSENKNKYFTVTTTSVVRAKNMKDALTAVSKTRSKVGEVLATENTVTRISAAEAKPEV